MKKNFLVVSLFLVFTLPILAQVEVGGEQIPSESLTLRKGNIPAPVIKAAQKLFEGSTQVAWGVFPYELKNYGWVVDNEYNEPIDHYEIKMVAKDGSDIYAVFESTGELNYCKIVNKKAPVPKEIVAQIEKEGYKDWKIVGDVLKVTNNEKKITEHYAVKVAKGNQTQTLYFTTRGENLAVK
jgi:hypothetical protein